MLTEDNVEGRATLTITDFELTPAAPEVVSFIDDITTYVYSADTVLSLFEVFEDVIDHDTLLTYTVAGNSNPLVATTSTISQKDGLLTLSFGEVGATMITLKVENLSGGFTTEDHPG